MSNDKLNEELNLGDTPVNPFDELSDLEKYSDIYDNGLDEINVLGVDAVESESSEGDKSASAPVASGEFLLDDNDMSSVLTDKEEMKSKKKIPLPVIISVSLVVVLFFGCVFTIRFAEQRKKATDAANQSLIAQSGNDVAYTASVNEEGNLVVNDVIIDDITGEDARQLAKAINNGDSKIITGLLETYDIPAKSTTTKPTTTKPQTTGNLNITKVGFYAREIEIACGSTVECPQFYFLPEGTKDTGVSFSSSNSQIAKVDESGKITGVKIGTTYIKVTSTVNKKLSDEITVKVVSAPSTEPSTTKPQDQTEVSSIVFNDVLDEMKNNDFITVSVNNSRTLDFILTPNYATAKDLVFTSSNPEICSVNDSGVITGITEDEAVITVAPRYGSQGSALEIPVVVTK